MKRVVFFTYCLLAGSSLATGPGPSERQTETPHLAPYRAVEGADSPPAPPLRAGARPAPLAASGSDSRDTTQLTPGLYYITSLGYPLHYPDLYDFTFPTFTGDQGQELRIDCPHVDIEYHATCDYDWISINGTRFCGSSDISRRSALSLTVQFHSDEAVTRVGFLCYIDVPDPSCCGRVGSARIMGGSEAWAHQFPWQAGVVSVGSNRTWCGGSLITSRYVLTAAHCVADKTAGKIEVLLGDHWIGQPDAGELRFAVERITVHQQYVTYTGGHDFALLRLASDVPISGAMSPVCLPPAEQTFAGLNATATGFGRTASDEQQSLVLRHVQLPVWDTDRCAAQVPNINTTTMVCAGGVASEATCSGDSGGPLVATLDGERYSLVGVTSFGYVPCGLAGYPSFYSRVSTVLGWIDQNTADAPRCR